VRASLIVCERRPEWAAAIARLWRESHAEVLPLVETRHLEELQEALTAEPTSFALVAADLRNMARVPRLLEWVTATLPNAAIAVAAPRVWKDWAPLWRAAGACHVVFSPRRLGAVARIISRHRARLGGGVRAT
jgi:hypothetical protein